jgi:uncharacterized membrane protein YgdD (TMEM256/DUF423 family)
MWTWWFAAGSFLSALAIGVGAFGAHALKGRLTPDDHAIFETATKYLTSQSMGLVLLSLLMSRLDGIALKIAAFAMIFGIVIFSGSLYGIIWSGVRWLGALTPIGGALMIAAWLLAAWAAMSAHWA